MKKIFYALFFASLTAAAQNGTPPPVTFTAEQDHQNMMDQLGVKSLRPGPSGNENDPIMPIMMNRKPTRFQICRMY